MCTPGSVLEILPRAEGTDCSGSWVRDWEKNMERIPWTCRLMSASLSWCCFISTNNTKCQRMSTLRKGLCTSAMMKITMESNIESYYCFP